MRLHDSGSTDAAAQVEADEATRNAQRPSRDVQTYHAEERQFENEEPRDQQWEYREYLSNWHHPGHEITH